MAKIKPEKINKILKERRIKAEATKPMGKVSLMVFLRNLNFSQKEADKIINRLTE